MSVNAPPGLPIRWYSHQNTSEKTYGVLKAKLTGIKSQFGHYYSEVKLSEADADKLIENIKRGSEGFPDLIDKTGIFNEEYQNWLVETYLPSAKTSENQTPSIEDSEEDYEDSEDNEEDDDDDDFEPLGLEEFLEDIQNEAKREKSLALYQGTREDDLVSEEIDERILRLLNLEDVFDIDYSTYMTLLREKLMEARMVDKKISTEESMLLTEEYKRVKYKVGRFKLKKKKIAAEDFDNIGVSKSKNYLTGSAVTPDFENNDREGENRLLNNIITINETLGRILESLTSQNQAIRDSEDDERRRQERLRRQEREEDLEKGISKVATFVSKVLAPVRGILDRILNFILYTLLGRTFVKFIDWFNDPKNKEKVEVLTRFLKDWWPALLGGLVLFTTPFGKFVRAFIGTVSKLTFRLAKFAIPKLAKFAMKNPVTATAVAGGALAAGGAYFATQQSTQRREEFKKTDPNIVTPKETKETGKTPGGSQLMQESVLQRGIGGFKGGGMIPFISQVPVESIAYEEGGYINNEAGVDITGAGPDTQLIAAQPGEIVMSKKAVDKYGAGFLLNLNKSAGGTNIPRMANNIQFAAGGGVVGSNTNSFMNKSKPPKISNSDYATLLAISALEDDKPQGRADVAQSIYNRLYSINKYGSNYNQGSNNTIKGLITAKSEGGAAGGGQYEPTFSNPKDWKNIKDLKTAAIAVMNSDKGKKYGYTMEIAMKHIKDTENALKNPKLQKNAAEHVKGRTYFLGTSQQDNMEKGDVLRGPTHNFFSMWYDEKSKYGKERANVSSPIPQLLLPEMPKEKVSNPAKLKPKTVGPKGIRESLSDDEGFSKFIPKNIRNLFKLQSSTNNSSANNLISNLMSANSTNNSSTNNSSTNNLISNLMSANSTNNSSTNNLISNLMSANSTNNSSTNNLISNLMSANSANSTNNSSTNNLISNLMSANSTNNLISNLMSANSTNNLISNLMSANSANSTNNLISNLMSANSANSTNNLISNLQNSSVYSNKGNINNILQKPNREIPGPPISKSNQSSFISLPDIIQQAGGQQVASGGSQVPQISDQITSTQRANASIYGIG